MTPYIERTLILGDKVHRTKKSNPTHKTIGNKINGWEYTLLARSYKNIANCDILYNDY